MARSNASKPAQPPKKKARRSNPEPSESDASDDQSGADSDSSLERRSSKGKGTRRDKQQKHTMRDGDRVARAETTKKGKARSKDVTVANVDKKKKKRASKHSESDQDEYKDDGDRDDSASDDDDEDSDADDGGKNTRVVKSIRKIPAPKSNPNTSVILPTTMEFLSDLRANNDREWFEENKAGRYTHALANFKAFMTAWVPRASEVDWQLPHLPTKDLVHRIYRDVRFSKDKTPYKTNFALSHSRTGRKGPFAFYYFHISPGDRSILAAGCWQPGAHELRAIRTAILADPDRLRRVLAEPEFEALYGRAEPTKDGRRTSIFGHDDQLKNAPKLEGVDKNHPDIDLLKCRSIAVESHFTDDEVVAPDFLDRVLDRMRVTAPFVQLLNEFISPSPPSDDEAEEGDGDEQDDADQGEGEEEEEEEEGEEEEE
ncbi:hypothetical protein JCM3766R1_006419 [Sporobolomyces carnicolor]